MTAPQLHDRAAYVYMVVATEAAARRGQPVHLPRNILPAAQRYVAALGLSERPLHPLALPVPTETLLRHLQ